MILLKKLFCYGIFLLAISCTKKNPDIDYPKEHYCEKFAGLYSMYDPLSDNHYFMTVSCIMNEDGWPDTIKYSNLANRFNFQDAVTEQIPESCIPTFIGTLKDYNGNSTVFSMGCGFSPEPGCMLRNDSLYLSFSIDNFAFYLSDGVSWEICDDCMHYGVKIH